MEIFPKDILDIFISRRNDDNRLIGPPVIELEIKKDILDPYSNWRRMLPTKNEKIETNFVIVGRPLASSAKNFTRQETKKIVKNIQ